MREGTVFNRNDILKGFLIKGEDEQGKTVKQGGLFCVEYIKKDVSKIRFKGIYHETQRIWDFKNGDEKAFNYFVERVNQGFDPKWEKCVCVAVPSSNSERKRTPIQKLVTRLVSLHPGMVDGSGVLVRTKSVPSAKDGGPRDPKDHFDSIIVDKNCGIDISGRNILLIDDVTTTGGSLLACKMILKKSGAVKVNILALAQTQNINIDLDSKYKDYQRLINKRILYWNKSAAHYFGEGKEKKALRSLENGLTYGLKGWREFVERLNGKHEATTRLIHALECLASGYSRVGQDEEAVKKYEDALELVLRKYLDLINTKSIEIINRAQFGSSDFQGLQKRYLTRNFGEVDSVNLVKDLLVFIQLVLGSGRKMPTAEMISNMDGLALSYLKIGRKEEAVKLFEGAVLMRKKLFQEENNPFIIPILISTMDLLAVSYLTMGRKEDAVKLYEELREFRLKDFQKKETPKTSLGLISAMNQLALSYRFLGRDEEARKLYEEVRSLFRHKALREEEEPKTTEELISAMNLLAFSYRELGRKEDAVELFEDVLSIRQEAFQKNENLETSLQLISAKNQLALIYCSVGRFEETRKLYKEVLSFSETALPKDAPNTIEVRISAMEKLANCSSEAGSFETENELRNELLKFYKKHYGECDPSTVNAKVDLANSLISLGKYEDAEELFKEVEVASIDEGGFNGLDRDGDTEALFQALSKLIEAEGYQSL